MQIFNHISELIIPVGILTKEGKAGMETHLVTVEINVSKCSVCSTVKLSKYVTYSALT